MISVVVLLLLLMEIPKKKACNAGHALQAESREETPLDGQVSRLRGNSC